MLVGTRDEVFNEVPAQLYRQAQSMFFPASTRQERVEQTAALVQLLACGLLAYSLVINLSTGATTTLAWALTSSASGLSPLADASQWSAFLTMHGKLRLALDPLLLPPRVVAGALLTRRYRRAVSSLQTRMPWRGTQPVASRALGLVLAWMLLNGLAVGCLTSLAVWASSLLTGVPLGWRPFLLPAPFSRPPSPFRIFKQACRSAGGRACCCSARRRSDRGSEREPPLPTHSHRSS